MKKLVMMMVLMLGTLAFGRDYDHRERNDIEQAMERNSANREMLTRERKISQNNMEKYEEFHWELMHMDRGESDR